MLDKPMGGTELMHQELLKRLPESYLEKYSIFNYLPQADTTKKLVYWNQLSYDQQAVQALQNQNVIDQIDQFVFVSHWQAEKFRQLFNIPGYKTTVIKNACIGVEQRQTVKKDKLKICYTSTPWRGLDVLLQAWEILQPQHCELHVFSSTKIYLTDFSLSSEGNYQELSEKCESLPNVIYRSSISNEQLRAELPTFDILAYPNTFEETSCISVIEALSAGLRVITSALGALPETTEGWSRMYPYLMDKNKHSEVFANILGEEINKLKSGESAAHLELQKQVYAPRWSWNERIKEWTNFLDTLTLNEQSTLERTSETLPNS
jgi:glycosyltransferase involved in cell wall biosynthesis